MSSRTGHTADVWSGIAGVQAGEAGRISPVLLLPPVCGYKRLCLRRKALFSLSEIPKRSLFQGMSRPRKAAAGRTLNDGKNTTSGAKRPAKRSVSHMEEDAPPISTTILEQENVVISTSATDDRGVKRIAIPPSPLENALAQVQAAQAIFGPSWDGDVSNVIAGRQKEIEKIRAFVKRCSHTRTGGSLYVGGCPGTGKTAIVGSICRELEEKPVEATVKRRRTVPCQLARDLIVRPRKKGGHTYWNTTALL